jgi:hypothetical protein
MDFGEVLSRAWQIIWKHKVLWIFGILASCTNSGGTGNPASTFTWQEEFPNQFERTFTEISDWQILAVIAAIFFVVLVIAIVVIFIGTIGRIGIIRGTMQAEQAEEKLSFGELFSGSMSYFWRVFLLNLLVGIGLFVFFMLAFAVVAVGGILTLGLGLLCLIPMLCLLVPVTWAIMVVLEQANIAIVVEDLGIMDGLKRGWEVVRLNPGPMIVMWLILVLGIGLIGGFIIGLPLMVTIFPILAGIFAEGDTALFGGLAVAALCFLAYLPILILLGGILRSYVGSAWTLTFMRLTQQAEPLEGEPLEPLPEAL